MPGESAQTVTARLVVDLSNKSATVQNQAGTVLYAWSGVTRRTALGRAATEGYVMVDGEWHLTSPPDGFWCLLKRIPADAAEREPVW